MSLREAPIGTRAPAVGGGAWWKTEHGWKWNGPDSCGDTFPTPGGDWDGRLLPGSPYTITIPGWRPTSLNKLMRLHYHKANRVKQEDARMLLCYAVYCGVPEATGPRRVSIHTVLTGRQKAVDPDALWKVVLDGLVKAKRLVDDSAAYCTLGPVTSERGARGSTEITLEEI